jgi:hypothetical protein
MICSRSTNPNELREAAKWAQYGQIEVIGIHNVEKKETRSKLGRENEITKGKLFANERGRRIEEALLASVALA